MAEVDKTQRGFTHLPAEITFKILEEMDNGSILACTQFTPVLNLAGVDMLLRRHGILNPAEYCEVGTRVPEDLGHRPPADVLSALISRMHQYPRIERLHCSIYPPNGFAISPTNDNPKIGLLLGETSDSKTCRLPAASFEARMAYAFNRLTQLLSRVGVVEEVTLRVSGWKFLPWTGLDTHMEALVDLFVKKGCRALQVQCQHSLSDSLTQQIHAQRYPGNESVVAITRDSLPLTPRPLPLHTPWVFTTSELKDNTKGKISRFLSSLKRENRQDSPTAKSRLPLPVRSRLTKLDADILFFHPTAVLWSNALSHTLTDLTLSFQGLLSYDFSFASRGLAGLFDDTSHLRSLALLQTKEGDITCTAPSLRQFTALTSLTLHLRWGSCFLGPPNGETALAQFLPSSLENLSISAKLVDFILPGISRPATLKEIEIHVNKDDRVHSPFPTIDKVITAISVVVAKIRRFFVGKQTAPSIAVRMSVLWQLNLVPGLWDFMLSHDAQRIGELHFVDDLRINCYPSQLETGEGMSDCVKLVTIFAMVKRVVVNRSADHRDGPRRQSDPIQAKTATSIARSIYSGCPQLEALRIMDNEYPRG